MKTVKTIIYRVTLIALAFCCLFGQAVPALAMEANTNAAPASYGISIALQYSDSEQNPHNLESYQKNTFLLQNSAGRFVQAEYSAADEAYLVTGFVDDEASATILYCGCNPEHPGELVILDLPEDTYFLTQTGTDKEFALLKDTVTISISSDAAIVNGSDVQMTARQGNYNVVPLQIMMSRGFNLPNPDGHAFVHDITVLMLGLLLIACSCLIIVYLWPKKIGKTKSE